MDLAPMDVLRAWLLDIPIIFLESSTLSSENASHSHVTPTHWGSSHCRTLQSIHLSPVNDISSGSIVSSKDDFITKYFIKLPCLA